MCDDISSGIFLDVMTPCNDVINVDKVQGQFRRGPLVTAQKMVVEGKCRNKKPKYRLTREKNGRALARAGQWEGGEAGKCRSILILDVQDLGVD